MKSITNKKQGRKPIGSVQRAIDILDLFAPRAPEMGTSEIARTMALPKSTVGKVLRRELVKQVLDELKRT